MDRLGKNMYFLVFMIGKLSAEVVRMKNSIGTISLGGFLQTSRGISFSSMRILGSYALVYLTAGEGHYQFKGQAKLPCRAGDLLIVFPEIAHAYGPPKGRKWSEIYVVFEGPVFDLWRNQGLLSPARPLLTLPPSPIHAKRMKEIAHTKKGLGPADRLSRVCELQCFMASVLFTNAASDDSAGAPAWPLWLDAATEIMRAEPALDLPAISRRIGLSYETFRKSFRAFTGESPAKFHNRIIFEEARKLMYEQRLSNKALADRLGFCDEFHFSRRFHLATGHTPSQFRRSLPR